MKKFEKIDQLVIIMANKGLRFMPVTKAVPKELFPIENKPALLYHMIEAYRSGIKKVCVIISKEKKASVQKLFSHDAVLEEEMKSSGKFQLLKELNEVIDNVDFTYIIQGNRRGTGGALTYAEKWTDGKPFAFMYGDDLCKNNKKPVIGQLMNAYEKTGKCVTGAKTFPMDEISKYSSIVKGKQLFERCHEMLDIIEKPKQGEAPSNLVGLARYVLTPDIFAEIRKCPAVDGEVRLTDAIANLAKQGKVLCFEFDGTYYDCGNKLEFAKCVVEHALEDKEICEKMKEFLKSKI